MTAHSGLVRERNTDRFVARSDRNLRFRRLPTRRLGMTTRNGNRARAACWTEQTFECPTGHPSQRPKLAEPGPTLNWRSKPPLIAPRRAEVDPLRPFDAAKPQRQLLRYYGLSLDLVGPAGANLELRPFQGVVHDYVSRHRGSRPRVSQLPDQMLSHSFGFS
jgi:hypothetical protein